MRGTLAIVCSGGGMRCPYSAGARAALWRLGAYSVSGTIATAFDLSLLWFLANTLGLFYLLAAGISSLFALTLHYAICRAWVFHGSARGIVSGYAYFLAILSASFALNLLLLSFFVEVFALPLLLARVSTIALVGLLSFALNARYNFAML